jgi:hypothetical protein
MQNESGCCVTKAQPRKQGAAKKKNACTAHSA